MREWRLRTSLILLLALTTLATAILVSIAILTIRLPQIQREASAQAQETATQLVQSDGLLRRRHRNADHRTIAHLSHTGKPFDPRNAIWMPWCEKTRLQGSLPC